MRKMRGWRTSTRWATPRCIPGPTPGTWGQTSPASHASSCPTSAGSGSTGRNAPRSPRRATRALPCYSLPTMPTNTTDATGLTVRGVPLEIVERGRGRPLLWLHGEEGPAPEAPFLDLLAAHGRVLAPSHPGFGHSPDTDRIDTVDDLAYLYLDLLAERDARDVIVMGASLGGWIAAEMAVKCCD